MCYPCLDGEFGGLERRGGSSASSDPNDASSYPTTPPASTHTHFRSIPKINGSEGGFIGLVAGLGVIVIVSCIAIFFLLRVRKRDRISKSYDPGYANATASNRKGSLLGRLGFKNSQRDGWLRAPDEDDEWDVRDTQDQMKLSRNPGTALGAGSNPYSSDPYSTPYQDPKGMRAVSSVSSVDLQASGRRMSYDEPFVPPVEVSTPTAVHSRDSMETVTTHPSGTKFRESLK